jgi:hypothetical protein
VSNRWGLLCKFFLKYLFLLIVQVWYIEVHEIRGPDTSGTSESRSLDRESAGFYIEKKKRIPRFGESAALTTHEWIVYRISSMIRSVGHRVKIHKVAPAVGNERDDVEIKDYVVFPPGQDNLLSSNYTVDFGRYDDA